MMYQIVVAGRTSEVDVRRTPTGWEVCVDGGPPLSVRGAQIGPAEWRLAVGDQQATLGMVARRGAVDLQIDGHSLVSEVIDPRRSAFAKAMPTAGELTAPLPGVVARVLVEEGQTVAPGDPLLVLEAMKMENEYRSPGTGVVETVHVAEGDAVELGASLVTLALEGG